MREAFSTVYEWVARTRGILLGFLDGIPWEVLTRAVPDAPHGSIRGLLLHTAGCYRWWLDYFAGGKPPGSRNDDSFADLSAVRAEFSVVDGIVKTFVDQRSGSPDTPFTLPMPRDHRPFTTTARWLFTHTTTHEFHHKGQIVMLCRTLGHPPVETDLWEPDWRSV